VQRSDVRRDYARRARSVYCNQWQKDGNVVAQGKLIHGGWLVRRWAHSERPIERGALYEEYGKIRAIGTYDELRQRFPDAQSIGDSTSIVMPGFINAHSHGRGLTTYQMGQPDEPLETRIVEFFGRPEWGATETGKLSPQVAYNGYIDTAYSCAKQIASGITTTVHSHQYIDGPVDAYAARTRQVVEAYRDSGMRCAFTLGVRDRSTFAFADDADFLARLTADARQNSDLRKTNFISFSEFSQLLSDLAAAYPQIAFQMGPWNPVFCSDELLQQIADHSRTQNWRIQTHLVETKYQAKNAHKRFGRSWVKQLHAIGMLSPLFSGAHCIWFDDGDIDLMCQSGAQVVHNPSSNFRLQSGIAPVRAYLAAGMSVAFGIDSLGMNDDEDMFQDLRFAQLIHASPGLKGELIPSASMLGMATHAGTTVAGIAGIGELREGNWADVVLMSRSEIEGVPSDHGLADIILKRARPTHIKTVMVGGRCLIEDGSWKVPTPAELLIELAKSRNFGTQTALQSTLQLKEAVRTYLEGSHSESRTS
jgi:5-methylthioadenosine/S-adenosylhomocysteine deaminase